VALKDAADEADFGRRLREFDHKLPPGRWMLGGNWDHDRTFAGELPTAGIIGTFVADRPVFLSRYDGHMAVVNSRVLTSPPTHAIRWAASSIAAPARAGRPGCCATMPWGW